VKPLDLTAYLATADLTRISRRIETLGDLPTIVEEMLKNDFAMIR
jgi:hypothetical protein